MSTISTPTDTFRSHFTGETITAVDADYDSARSLWNGAFDRHPTLIARCHSAADVAAAIQFGRGEGLDISVRGGAHSFTGASIAEQGLMIDLSQMRDVTVDPAARRAVCGGGATLADLDAATQAHGLAVTGGVISHTGVGGLTLGGGMGWLLRQSGLTVDNLVAAEVVLADGLVIRASAHDHPDLFWALRGGGGNFGVVTAFEFALHPVGPEVHLGMLFWELEDSTRALRLCREILEDLPDNAGAMVAAGLNAPPAPFIPEQYHLVPGCMLLLAGFSDADDHARLIRPAKESLPPLFEFTTPLPYVRLQQLLDDSAPWGALAYSKALNLHELTDDAIEVMSDYLPRKSSEMSFAPCFPLGGAYRRIGEADTAFGGRRDARFVLSMDAVAFDRDVWEADRAWVRSFWNAMLPHASGVGSYVNFMAENDEDRVRAAYGPGKYQRLARVKAAYDPGNVFHLNQNIKPSTEGFSATLPG